MKPIKVTNIKASTNNVKYAYEKKELISGFSLLGLRKNTTRDLVTIKFYTGRSRNSSIVYCNFWASDDRNTFSGSGTAGGGGYHKASAALQEAINSSGIRLNTPIDGRGDSSMREAIKAIGNFFGYRKLYLVSF